MATTSEIIEKISSEIQSCKQMWIDACDVGDKEIFDPDEWEFENENDVQHVIDECLDKWTLEELQRALGEAGVVYKDELFIVHELIEKQQPST